MSDDFSQLKDEEKEKLIEIEKDDLNASPTYSPSSETTSSPSKNNSWVAGVILIAIGIVFLATNLGGFTLNNWWALFILIPAAFTFGNAYSDYNENGRLTKKGRGDLTGGLIMSLIGCTFLFGWDWGKIWPLFLIIGGISALLGSWSE
jgi:hypothetical protein